MSDPRICSECGASLEAAGESGMCASCLFQMALDAGRPEEGDGGVDSPPPRIPGYEIRERLGRGGMGDVWRADQQEPVRRSVAIKVIRAGFDSDEVAARFEAERQALALMDHPGVARFYDAGTTSDGRPYFVMEYVPGVPITQFCNERRMPVDDRVRLMVEVSDAVHSAHQKGILHRDLKPSNILVLERLGRPETKVIDFGIAKATRPRVFDRTRITRADQLLGTPEYMSPEQLLGEEDVDIRTDVYGLGAVLYELLTDTCPVDREKLASVGLGEVLRHVREDETPSPSERVTTLGAAGSEAALARSTRRGALVSKLRGDLDWITMKALAKERDRRYGTAAALAEDQNRYLRHEPVSAGPPSLSYRFRKFLRRHPAEGAAGGVLLGALVVFSVAMGLQAKRLAQESARANEQAAVSQQVKDFLVELFRVSDPGEARGNEVKAREILDRGAARIRDEVMDPAVRTELLREMGLVYSNLGLFAEAESLFQETADLQVAKFGPGDPRTLANLDELAGLYNARGHSAAAESLYLLVVDGWRNVTDEEDARFLNALHNLAMVYVSQDRPEEAEALFLRVIETRRRLGEQDEPGAMAALSNLANLYKTSHRFDEAETLYREAVERRRRVLGADHPRTLLSQGALGNLFMMQERFDQAESLLTATAEAEQRILGEDHPRYWNRMEQLGQLEWLRGNHAAAAEAIGEVLELRRTHLGPEHPKTLVSMHNLSGLLYRLGRLAEAESLATHVLDVRKRTIGEKHNNAVLTLFVLTLIAAEAGERDLALARLRRLIELGFIRDALLADDNSLKNYRSDPEFAALFEEVRRQLEEAEESQAAGTGLADR